MDARAAGGRTNFNGPNNGSSAERCVEFVLSCWRVPRFQADLPPLLTLVLPGFFVAFLVPAFFVPFFVFRSLFFVPRG